MNVKTVSKNNSTGLLEDGKITRLGGSASNDSMAIAGQVSLSSHKAFTVTPGANVLTILMQLKQQKQHL